MAKLILFHTNKDQEYFFDLYPFFFTKKHSLKLSCKDFSFFSNVYFSNEFLYVIVTRWYYSKFSSFFNNLTDNNNVTLYLYDSCDGSDDLDSSIPDVFSKIFRKQQYCDFNNYRINMVGGKHFSNYYFEKYGVENRINKDRHKHYDDKVLSRLVIFHNNLVGFYLDNVLPTPIFFNKLMRVLIKFFINKNLLFPVRFIYKLHSKYISEHLGLIETHKLKSSCNVYLRFGYLNYDTSVSFHRKSVIDFFVSKDLAMIKNIGPTKAPFYRRELKNMHNIHLSPFGTGEICYRDFEIIYNNNYLVKPNMMHINTYPNVYSNPSLQYNLDFSHLEKILSFDNISEFQKQLEKQKFILSNTYKNLDNSVDDLF
jgi:hypothetical protein